MTESYDPRQRMAEARQRLQAALNPQTNREHYIVDWLISSLIADECDEWTAMIERRITTSARAARIEMANRTLSRWNPNDSAPPTEVQAMEYLASGGDPEELPRPLREWGRTAVRPDEDES